MCIGQAYEILDPGRLRELAALQPQLWRSGPTEHHRNPPATDHRTTTRGGSRVAATPRTGSPGDPADRIMIIVPERVSARRQSRNPPACSHGSQTLDPGGVPDVRTRPQAFACGAAMWSASAIALLGRWWSWPPGSWVPAAPPHPRTRHGARRQYGLPTSPNGTHNSSRADGHASPGGTAIRDRHPLGHGA